MGLDLLQSCTSSLRDKTSTFEIFSNDTKAKTNDSEIRATIGAERRKIDKVDKRGFLAGTRLGYTY